MALEPLYENTYSEMYTVLKLQDKEIRLLEVGKGDFHSAIKCNLSNVVLNDEAHYSALSYVWGDKYSPDPISVNGQPTRITANLEAAIRRLRQNDKSIVIWIDALCINQRDIPERNDQVQLMGDIYRKADRVLAWVGAEDTDTDGVLQTIQIFGKSNAIHWDIDPTPFDLPARLSADRVLAIVDFLRRPWWTRVWTVQEAILPRNLTFLCGSKKLPAQDLFSFAENFFKHTHSERCCYLPPTVDRPTILDFITELEQVFMLNIHRRNTSKEKLSVTALMASYRNRACNDPKDKVYGYLGFAIDWPKEILKPNYLALDKDVYADFAFFMLEGSLSFFAWVLPQQILDKEKSLIEGLPSWAPDWTIQVSWDIIRNVGKRQASKENYTASHGKGLFIKRPEPGKITLRGVIFGAIEAVGEGREWGVASREDAIIIQGWKNLAQIDENPRHLYRELQHLYLWGVKSTESMYDAFRQVLCSSLNREVKRADGFAMFMDSTASLTEYEAIWKWLTSPHDHSLDEAAEGFLIQMTESMTSRRFFISKVKHEWIGLVPLSAQEGDQLAIFGGGAVPYVIRPRGESGKQEWTFIGEAYVHGAMYGEATCLGNTQEISLI